MPPANLLAPASSGDLQASGFIEAEQVEVAAEIGGRIADLPVEEGQEVQAGEVLARLDDSVLQAQREILLAQVDLTTAQRDRVAAGVRPELIRQAEGQVAAAQAAVNAAQVALADAVTLRSNPQDIHIQVIDAETQVSVAQQQLAASQLQFEIAQDAYESAVTISEDINEFNAESTTFDLPMPFEVAAAPYQLREAQAALQSAVEALAGAEALVAALKDLEANPGALQVQVAQAAAALETTSASLVRAQAELDALRAGPRAEDLAVADAAIEEAQAAVGVLDAQITRMTITAPIGGLVLEQTVRRGELAVPGVPLVTLANLDQVELEVYVTAAELGRVRLNQPVTITVDSFPGRRFEGEVVRIADEAEFTPRNVQTSEERASLVYAVTIRIMNPDHALKPGMPADARFRS
ncbi:MAG: hypothetical protein Kow00124_00820 [Anaerolineae bacterium]